MRYAGNSGGYKRPLLKKDIEIAYAHANSASEAARYLGVSYNTFKKYAKLYDMWYTNPGGKGIPRVRKRGEGGLLDILEGKKPGYDKHLLMERCLRAGIFERKCYACGYDERRIDGKTPLLFYMKDGDPQNLRKENLEPRCYNCMYMTTGKVNKKVLEADPDVYNQDLSDLKQMVENMEDEDEDALNDLQKFQRDLLAEIESERDGSS